MFECKSTPQGSKWLEVSLLKVSRMLFKGCAGYLVSIIDTTKKVATELADVRVVCRILDVFPKEIARDYHRIEKWNSKPSYYLEQHQYPKHPTGWLHQS